jgi:hypothetical protein
MENTLPQYVLNDVLYDYMNDDEKYDYLRNLSKSHLSLAKRNAFRKLVSAPVTIFELQDYIDTGISHILLSLESERGQPDQDGYRLLNFSLLYFILGDNLNNLVFSRQQKNKNNNSEYGYIVGFDNGQGSSINNLDDVYGGREISDSFDILTIFNILKTRANTYFSDITVDDIKHYILNMLQRKYESQDQYESLKFIYYLIFNAIIMNIPYGHNNRFLSGQDEIYEGLSEDEAVLINNLYNAIVDRVSMLE